MKNVLHIADEMLKIAKRRGEKLTPMKLMKLVYIAQGFSLAARGCPLFSNRIEAWKYGPVVPDLYHSTKKFGRDPIPFEMISDDGSFVEQEISNFLEQVYNAYGHLSATKLSSLTHQSGSPWDQVFEPGVFGIEIPVDVIRGYYERKLGSTPSTSS